MKALIMSKLLSSACAAALALAFSMQAQANPISINGTFGPVTFTEVQPGNELEVSSPGFQGQAEYQGAGPGLDTGVAVFGAMDFTTAGSLITPPPPNPDPSVPPISQDSPYFPASGAQSFTYQANDDPDNPSMGANPDSLSMNITWTSLVPNAPAGEPQLFGTGVITSISGDDTFTMDFGTVDSLVNIFANFPLSTGSCDLTQLATGAAACMGATFELAGYEGGDATPGSLPPPPPPLIETPEPMSSFTVLGLALCGLWGAYLMMRRERGRSGFRLVHETSV